ncbi:hypothetical protein [Flavobacterium sp. CAU 1735]
MDTTTTMSPALKSHFLSLYQIAMSDAGFLMSELEVLYHLADEKGFTKQDLGALLLNPVTYGIALPERLETRIEYLYDLTRMIWASGRVTSKDREALKKYCIKFEFLDENIEDLTDYFIDCVQKGVQKEEIINQLNA